MQLMAKEKLQEIKGKRDEREDNQKYLKIVQMILKGKRASKRESRKGKGNMKKPAS